MLYQYAKACDSSRLKKEIEESAIVTALDRIEGSTSAVSIYFKANLSEGDETILDGLVDDHVNEPLPENVIPEMKVVELPEPVAFAQPTHRTKLYAIDSVVDCAVNAETTIDFLLSEELWIYGGEIIITNAEIGDWLSAEIYDSNEIIPEAYRAALCEAWPSVAKYIHKRFIRPASPSSIIAIDTRPLIAKVTAGLALRVTYNAVNAGSTRKLAGNYFSVKAL